MASRLLRVALAIYLVQAAVAQTISCGGAPCGPKQQLLFDADINVDPRDQRVVVEADVVASR